MIKGNNDNDIDIPQKKVIFEHKNIFYCESLSINVWLSHLYHRNQIQTILPACRKSGTGKSRIVRELISESLLFRRLRRKKTQKPKTFEIVQVLYSGIIKER